MLYPSIDKLLEKVDSKYSLVVATARRVRNIQGEMLRENVKGKTIKPVTTALEEILAGVVKYQRTKEDVK